MTQAGSRIYFCYCIFLQLWHTCLGIIRKTLLLVFHTYKTEPHDIYEWSKSLISREGENFINFSRWIESPFTVHTFLSWRARNLSLSASGSFQVRDCELHLLIYSETAYCLFEYVSREHSFGGWDTGKLPHGCSGYLYSHIIFVVVAALLLGPFFLVYLL